MFKFNDDILSNEEFLDEVQKSCPQIVKGRDKIEYYNIPAAFDIETSSFYYNDEKCATMYIWQICVNGYITVGRTWEQFVNLIDNLSSRLECYPEKRHLIIYVHNLAYEFQFMRKWFTWERVFSLSNRKPLKAVMSCGIEFRCSYLLSGYSLAKLGDKLVKYNEKKQVGLLDYSLIRTSSTPIKDFELKYCIYDVRVVTAYIQEKIENEGGITKIPLTKTGYVRNYCREKCLYREGKTHSRNRSYNFLISSLTLEPQEYHYLKQAFQGGFTHANYHYVPRELGCEDKIEYDVTSKDFTSSYPAVILSEKFPMSKGKKVKPKTEESFRKYIKKYCCVFNITMYGVSQKSDVYENPISASRCIEKKNGEILSSGISENNGRVHYADKLTMIITEVDLEIYEKFYDIERIDYETITMYIYEPGFLPKEIIESTLHFYETKTTLKDVEGKEIEYMQGKENLNSIYGMMVTDICRDVITYDGKWSKAKPDYDGQIDIYNKSKKRFLFYPWGIYITAYARRNLFSGIYALGEDYIYSDTDSVKFLNYQNHMEYFTKYNAQILRKISRCLDFYGIDINRASPKTIEGVPKPIGVWDDDGFYTRFKTLGAKRYMVEYEKNGELKHKITVAGLGKESGIKWLEENYDDVFEGFNTEMCIPAGETGKNTHTYLDWDEEPAQGIITDYMGNKCHFYEKSAIHLEECSFDMSLSDKFAKFLMGYQEV